MSASEDGLSSGGSPPRSGNSQNISSQVSDDAETNGRKQSPIGSEDEDMKSDAEDEDVLPRTSRRRAASDSDSEAVKKTNGDAGTDISDDEGLFGSDGGRDEDAAHSDAQSEPRGSDDERLPPPREVYGFELGRHALPKGDDGETYILKMPQFLGIEPVAFHNKTFQPPTTDHHSNKASEHFSAYDTAMNTIRWRRSPSNPNELQSNARLLRWEDGSITLQMANNAAEQFVLVPKALAPPQINPKKPVPTSRKLGSQPASQAYDPNQDSFTYITTPHEGPGILQVTHHVTTQLNVLPNKSVNDESVMKLTQSYAAAMTKDGKGAGTTRLIEVTEDPELEKKRIEADEKARAKARKRKEAAEQRQNERAAGIFSRGGRGGLTVEMLEDEDGLGMGPSPRKRAAPGSGQRKRPSRRRQRDDYDSDDDDMPRGRTREDEYDKEDDFVAASDEEPEVYEDNDDLDAEGEVVDEDEEEEEEARTREREREQRRRERSEAEAASAKRASPEADGGGASRAKRRRFVEDDDDDE